MSYRERLRNIKTDIKETTILDEYKRRTLLDLLMSMEELRNDFNNEENYSRKKEVVRLFEEMKDLFKLEFEYMDV